MLENKRSSGILIHITSLPSDYGIGDFGPGAYRFVDFLIETQQTFWQMLPLNPTNPFTGNSPYTSPSSFAGNTLLISPDIMLEDGFITREDLNDQPQFDSERVDYEQVIDYKEKIFLKAFERFKNQEKKYDFEKFCEDNAGWLEDYSSFIAFKNNFNGKIWTDWPAEIRDRNPEAVNKLKQSLNENITMEKFLQFIFYMQWNRLKKYCNDRRIQIIGDIPYYVSYDSADVWTFPEIFKLDPNKKPHLVGGVPPDYFSETGQLWGNPVYDWHKLKESGYSWWIRRMKNCLNQFNLVRIDHFRGFVAYWEVPANEDTAINGHWVEAPAIDFFNTMLKYFPNFPIIAEDLGFITPDVNEVIQNFGFPGMRLLIFAFDESLPRNPYAPHQHIKNCVVYTATHDNNTIRGWFENDVDEEQKQRIFKYFGTEISNDEVHWQFIRMALMSVAGTVILPMQDVLGLGENSRMNFPSRAKNNWTWRLKPELITEDVVNQLRDMVKMFARD
jgi:4-alpha-glucanotransferase